MTATNLIVAWLILELVTYVYGAYRYGWAWPVRVIRALRG